jgi:hypothetical protein
MHRFMFVALLITGSIAACSDQQYRIGLVDQLILKRAIAENGLATVQRDVENHEFSYIVLAESAPQPYSYRWDPISYTPYIISYVCTKDDQSELSKAVFRKIRDIWVKERAEKFPGNSLNAERQKNRIDFCTNISEVNGSNDIRNYIMEAQRVLVTAAFFDRASLLAELK